MRLKNHAKKPAGPARTSEVERRTALTKLSTETLVDTLINLARWNKEVDNTIERLVSTPDKYAERFKHQLANLSCMNNFVEWRGLRGLAHELEFLLMELKAGVIDGRTGFALVVSFFERDQDVMENCDDDGFVGAVFETDALELLTHYGARCDDKIWLCDQLMELYKKDDYGLRSNIFDNAAQYLPVENVRQLITRIEVAQQNEPKNYDLRRWSSAIECLAGQLKAATPTTKSARGKRQAESVESK